MKVGEWRKRGEKIHSAKKTYSNTRQMKRTGTDLSSSFPLATSFHNPLRRRRNPPPPSHLLTSRHCCSGRGGITHQENSSNGLAPSPKNTRINSPLLHKRGGGHKRTSFDLLSPPPCSLAEESQQETQIEAVTRSSGEESFPLVFAKRRRRRTEKTADVSIRQNGEGKRAAVREVGNKVAGGDAAM